MIEWLETLGYGALVNDSYLGMTGRRCFFSYQPNSIRIPFSNQERINSSRYNEPLIATVWIVIRLWETVTFLFFFFKFHFYFYYYYYYYFYYY